MAALALAAAILFGAAALGPTVSGILLSLPITGSIMPPFTLRLYGADALARLQRGFVAGLTGFTAFFLVVSATLGALGVVGVFRSRPSPRSPPWPHSRDGCGIASEICARLICLNTFSGPCASVDNHERPSHAAARAEAARGAPAADPKPREGHAPRAILGRRGAGAQPPLVRKRLPVQVFEHLGERPFSIEVRDADLVMAFRFRERRFVPVPHAGEEPLRFRVNASDFATLAAPEDAPDDHPFLHDLVVVGDPDIAAEVHKALEGIDVVRTRRILRRAVRLAKLDCARG